MRHPQMIINKKSALFIIFVSSFLIYTLSHNLTNYNENTFYSVDNEDYVDKDLGYLIHTEGCKIPNYGRNFKYKEAKIIKKNCGDRAVFLSRSNTNQELDFRIDTKLLDKYGKNRKVNCFYRFAEHSGSAHTGGHTLSYTQWKPFGNGTNITVLKEIITVKCDAAIPAKNKTETVYKDAYAFIKKQKNLKHKTEEQSWNVLIVGMDTMSRERLRTSMPKTAKYFKDHGWLDYRGYHKVAYNTFPNVMAFLTGRKMKTIYSNCTRNIYDCNELFVWSNFRNAGYMTAYGEDNLNLPDTFSRYNGFRINPTHHYIRPFFFTGETQVGNLVCAHQQPSALQLLNYAHDYTHVYKEYKFFGMIWINSYSHNLVNNPHLLDTDMVSFFNRLNENDTLNNTIILFISDHGLRFGKMRVPIESYYEERLPMLFMWVPRNFRKLHEHKYYNLQLNQNRLVTPYDVYLTLAEISSNFKTTTVKSEACSQCTSMFVEKSIHRTCEDAGISGKWCSCHAMTEADRGDNRTVHSIDAAVKAIQDKAKSIKTKTSQGCRPLRLHSVIRVHRYSDSKNQTFVVVAWKMTPGGMSYEATVAQNGANFTVLEPTYGIASYAGRGSAHCVKNIYDHEFCVC